MIRWEMNVRLFASKILRSQFPDPDIPKADGFAGVAMILKLNGTGPMLLDLWKSDIGCGTVNPCMVLHNDPIVNNGYIGVCAIGAI